ETSKSDLEFTNESEDLVGSELTYEGDSDESSDSDFTPNQL
ncbi:5151_t:CDS:1, partial [Scutellospora calospora]